MSEGIACLWMRGGTSKGGFFLADDLPSDPGERDAILLRVMGSPDPRQIDGMGGGDPLASKVAVVRASQRPDTDVDYLFLQVFVDQALVRDGQNCGNMLAGVGPFAIERGLVAAKDGQTPVRIFMENTGQTAVATVETPASKVSYRGSARIDGVPGTAAPVPLAFQDTAGSSCGALLPTGQVCDTVEGLDVTMIDNGMPCVLVRAQDLGISGQESPAELEANSALKERVEALRLACGPLMNLGDVSEKSVPKMTLVSRASQGGAIATRSFIPHRCHKAVGVLAAVSVATACLMKGSVAYDLAERGESEADGSRALSVEHPTGEMTIIAQQDDQGAVSQAAVLRTARKLMGGQVFA